MSLLQDIEDYETWLRSRCTVFEQDLVAVKREKMEKSPLKLLRATYFRWAATVERRCPELVADAPEILSVGDIHLENYGTWRDGDGRLVWGVNDFDEAAVMPWTLDPLRLLTSLLLLGRGESGMTDEAVAEAVLAGYRDGLGNPRPTILDAAADGWMQPLIASRPADIASFWTAIDETLAGKGRRGGPGQAPSQVAKALQAALPDGTHDVVLAAVHGKGGGSLGRPRYIAVGCWQGARVVREAKAVVPSAWNWAHRKKAEMRPPFVRLAAGRYRSPDPTLRVDEGAQVVIRRIAADARKIEIDAAALGDRGPRLVAAMARDLGAIHAADRTSGAIAPDLKKRNRRNAGWLLAAALAMKAAVEADHAKFRKLRKSGEL